MPTSRDGYSRTHGDRADAAAPGESVIFNIGLSSVFLNGQTGYVPGSSFLRPTLFLAVMKELILWNCGQAQLVDQLPGTTVVETSKYLHARTHARTHAGTHARTQAREQTTTKSKKYNP